MIKSDNFAQGLPLYLLYPGENHYTSERSFLGTITGSCLVICLFDPFKKMGAMGHFIIPGTLGTEGLYRDEIAELGIIHLELMIANFVKAGGDRKNLIAKIFGAGYHQDRQMTDQMVAGNIDFIRKYMINEKIQVKAEDLGGYYRRKVLFRPDTGEAFRKILEHNAENSEFIALEREYIDKVFRSKSIKTNYILFE